MGACAFIFGPTVSAYIEYFDYNRTAPHPCGFDYGFGYSASAAGYGYGYGYGPACGGSGHVNPSVTLQYPDGGETFVGGSGADINWSSSGTDVTGVRISYSLNGGSTWTVITSSNEIGYLLWSVPNSATTQARMKAEAMQGDTVLATDTGGNFTITAGSGGGGGGGGGGAPTGGAPVAGTTSTEGSNTDGGSTSGTTMTRAEANACLPAGYQVDSLVKIPDDGNASTEYDTTVYYLGFDCKRHPFPHRSIYDSWYDSFSGVQAITLENLGSIQLGAPILVRPGTNWVKITSDPKTYYVAPGNKLRWVKDQATAEILGGTDWNTKIIDIDPSLFTLFAVGADIDVTYLATSWPAGSIMVSSSDAGATRYYVTATGRRAFSGPDAFNANKFQAKFVETTPSTAGWMNKSPEAQILGLEDLLFSLMH